MAPNDSTVDAGGTGTNFQQNISDDHVSKFVLACIKELKDCYPQPVDTANLAQIFDIGPVGEQALGLFRDSGFISGPDTQTILTLRGQRSIRFATESEHKVAQYFLGQSNADPNEVLLAIWRTHFYAWDGNKFGEL